MYGIFTYVYRKKQPFKYAIHGWCRYGIPLTIYSSSELHGRSVMWRRLRSWESFFKVIWKFCLLCSYTYYWDGICIHKKSNVYIYIFKYTSYTHTQKYDPYTYFNKYTQIYMIQMVIYSISTESDWRSSILTEIGSMGLVYLPTRTPWNQPIM